MPKRVRIAQYGISHAHAAGHAAVLRENPDVKFCGVFEPSPEVRASLGRGPAYDGVHWFASVDEMLDDPTIEAIAIEGAVRENLGFARESLEHGKHIWLDKPAGDDLDEFRRLIDLARERRLLVQLGYMFRYNDAFQRVITWVQGGMLGEIFSIRGRMSTYCDPPTREALAFHRGGILFELLGHLIDIVVELLGRPGHVTSYLRNEWGITPGFADNTLTVFEYDGAMAMLESAALEVSPFPCRRFEVYGRKGSAIIEPLEPPKLRLCLDEARDGFEAGWQEIPVENRRRYVDDVIAFVADIRDEKTPDRTLDHELLVQETLLRAAQGEPED